MKLDKADHLILKHLQEDARLSMRDLAALTGVSTPTVSSKVKALEALGVIRAYRAVLDPKALGRSGHVLEVHARPMDAPKVAAALLEQPGVDDVLELAGGVLHARYFGADAQALQGFLATLATFEGIQSYRLHPVLAERAGAHGLAEPGDEIAVECHECEGPIHGTGVHKRWEAEGHRDHWFCCRNCSGTYEKRLLARVEGAAKARR